MADESKFRPVADQNKAHSAADFPNASAESDDALPNSSTLIRKLPCNTDLNEPPKNWLCGTFSRQRPWSLAEDRQSREEKIPPTASGGLNQNFTPSWNLAKENVEALGKVDVITDGRNMKRLLSLPYRENAPMSILVHRIGRTLLLDEFQIMNNLGEEINSEQCDEFGQVRQQVIAKMARPEQADHMKMERSPTDRSVLWTFEDITMLVGTDMPIFGCGTHPCLSLKLRDMCRPINVLTGLDYWLDQLMCHVPEVLMCYHLDGMVQKYELVQTEDLPSMNEAAFDPALVRDVASNLLSFLKSKATKEGHTYWLFKGENDDVVKLYDLSSICSEYTDRDPDANPFTLPVAMLMFKMARNLSLHAAAHGHTRKVANTIYRLLHNCLDLLSADKYPQICASCHQLLCALYLSYGLESGVRPGANPPGANGTSDNATDNLCMQPFENDDWRPMGRDSSVLAQVQIGTPGFNRKIPNLHAFPEQNLHNKANVNAPKTQNSPSIKRKAPVSPSKKGGASAVKPNPNFCAFSAHQGPLPLPNGTNVYNCCTQALDHVYEGLACSEIPALENPENADSGGEPVENENVKIVDNPPESGVDPGTNRAIPLKYERIEAGGCRSSVVPKVLRHEPWQLDLKCTLLLRASRAYRTLAEYDASLGKHGRSLRHLRHSVKCACAAWHAAKHNVNDSDSVNRSKDVGHLKGVENGARCLVASALLLCGEDFAILGGEESTEEQARHEIELNGVHSVHHRDKGVSLAEKIFECEKSQSLSARNFWQKEIKLLIGSRDDLYRKLGKMHELIGTYYNRRLVYAVTAESAAVDVVLRSLGCNDKSDSDDDEGSPESKRQENVSSLEQDPAPVLDETDSEKSKFSEENRVKSMCSLVDVAAEHFRNGIECFEKCGDIVNMALLHSNFGQCLRIKSHANMVSSDTELSQTEQNWLKQSIQAYAKGVDLVKGPSANLEVWTLVGKELAGACVAYATQLQERPPILRMGVEQVEREISDYMHRALAIYDTMVSHSEHYGLRSGDIAIEVTRKSFEVHYRLASMYHRAYRGMAASSSTPSATVNRRTKNLLRLCELHYTKALGCGDDQLNAILVKRELDKSDKNLKNLTKILVERYLRATMEFVAVAEHQSAAAQTLGQKSRLNATAMHRLSNRSTCRMLTTLADKCYDTVDSSNGDKNDFDDTVFELLSLMQGRLEGIAKDSLAAFMQNKKKKEAFEVEMAAWKRCYGAVLKQTSSVKVSAGNVEQNCRMLALCLAAACEIAFVEISGILERLGS